MTSAYRHERASPASPGEGPAHGTERTGNARGDRSRRWLQGANHDGFEALVHPGAENDALFREIGYRAGEANALDNLGLIYRRQDYYPQAAECHQQAITLFREIGHRAGEANALSNLGLVYRQQGHYGQATEYHQQALILFREIGHRAGEADALDNLGLVYRRQGYYPQAAECHQQALSLCSARSATGTAKPTR